MPSSKPDHQAGQFLIEIMVATAIFAILASAIISLIVILYQSVADVRIKTIARHLASERMELITNLAYANVGTTAGIPHGDLSQYEQINRNGFIFTVHTSITYIDDPYDGIAPADLLPTDYKQARVEVSWQSQLGIYRKPIVLVSTIAPKGIETVVNGGTLSIFVIDAMAQPISSANVSITNTTVNPSINIDLQTNQSGYLILPGAPPCASCYNISVTKSGYSTDKTYTTSEVANPNKRPLTVAVNTTTQSTFVIDKVAELSITSYSGTTSFTLAPNTNFRLTGAKTLGLDSHDNPVYKYDYTLNTGVDSQLKIANMEWDTYILTLPASQNKLITGIYPHQPISIMPDTKPTLKFSTTPKTTYSLLLSLKDASGSAIATASARLNLANLPVATQSSGLIDQPNFGQSFFYNLTNATYSFTISHPQFQDLTGNVLINGNVANSLVMIKNN